MLCPKLDPSGLVEAEPVAEGRGGGKTESGGIAGIGNEQFSGYSESGDGQVVDGFDNSLPVMPKAPEKKWCLPYVLIQPIPNIIGTPFIRKIKVDKDTWRGDEFYALKILMIPTNWAKHPFDAGPRETVEQIEATGLRYRVTERANNMAVGGWQGASGGGISGLDLMTPFTREFWNFKGRKRRARTLEVLKAYGDSITVLEQQ